jgi:hypothetical protein
LETETKSPNACERAVPEGSRSRENFVRLAEARVVKLLRGLDLLGNLSNRSNYTYDAEDVKKIFVTLRKKLREEELRFEMQAGRRKQDTFKL